MVTLSLEQDKANSEGSPRFKQGFKNNNGQGGNRRWSPRNRVPGRSPRDYNSEDNWRSNRQSRQRRSEWTENAEEHHRNDVGCAYTNEEMQFKFRTAVCNHSCTKDPEQCFHSHARKPQRRAIQLVKGRFNYIPKTCPEFSAGVCSKGDKCPLAHSWLEMIFHPLLYRTKPCEHLRDPKTGLCKGKGIYCAKAHKKSEIRNLVDIYGSNWKKYYDNVISYNNRPTNTGEKQRGGTHNRRSGSSRYAKLDDHTGEEPPKRFTLRPWRPRKNRARPRTDLPGCKGVGNNPTRSTTNVKKEETNNSAAPGASAALKARAAQVPDSPPSYLGESTAKDYLPKALGGLQLDAFQLNADAPSFMSVFRAPSPKKPETWNRLSATDIQKAILKRESEHGPSKAKPAPGIFVRPHSPRDSISMEMLQAASRSKHTSIYKINRENGGDVVRPTANAVIQHKYFDLPQHMKRSVAELAESEKQAEKVQAEKVQAEKIASAASSNRSSPRDCLPSECPKLRKGDGAPMSLQSMAGEDQETDQVSPMSFTFDAMEVKHLVPSFLTDISASQQKKEKLKKDEDESGVFFFPDEPCKEMELTWETTTDEPSSPRESSTWSPRKVDELKPLYTPKNRSRFDFSIPDVKDRKVGVLTREKQSSLQFVDDTEYPSDRAEYTICRSGSISVFGDYQVFEREY